MTVIGENGLPIPGVFLLGDHEIVRRGLRELLEDEPDIEVMTRAAPGGSCAVASPPRA